MFNPNVNYSKVQLHQALVNFVWRLIHCHHHDNDRSHDASAKVVLKVG